MKSLKKTYQLLVIFACFLYGLDITKTFPQSWVVMLDQLENEGRLFNWSDVLALQLKVHVSYARSLPKDEQARFYMFAYLLDVICAQW